MEDKQIQIRQYLKAAIRFAGKYPLDDLTDEDLRDMAVLADLAVKPFDLWSAEIYGKVFEDMTEAEAAAINDHAKAEDDAMYGRT